VARGVIVVAPLWAGRCRTARPDATIDRVDGLALRKGILSEQLAQGWAVHMPLGQGRVEAPPPASVDGFLTQMHRREHLSRRQQRIREIHQGIGAVLKAAIERVTKGVQGGEGCRLIHSLLFCHQHAHTVTHAILVVDQQLNRNVRRARIVALHAVQPPPARPSPLHLLEQMIYNISIIFALLEVHDGQPITPRPRTRPRSLYT